VDLIINVFETPYLVLFRGVTIKEAFTLAQTVPKHWNCFFRFSHYETVLPHHCSWGAGIYTNGRICFTSV